MDLIAAHKCQATVARLVTCGTMAFSILPFAEGTPIRLFTSCRFHV